MKRQIITLAIIALLPILAFANNDYGKKNKEPLIRQERNFALSLESGWRTLSGVGLNATFFPQTNIGVDLGVGVSLLGTRAGVRGRYLISKKNFSPYVGVGLTFSPTSIDDIEIEDVDTGVLYYYDTKSSLFGQVLFGLEYISNGGFYIGWNIGYAPSLKDNYSFQQTPSDNVELGVRLVYGSSISTALNIGYAF
jgi:hypothetical protein